MEGVLSYSEPERRVLQIYRPPEENKVVVRGGGGAVEFIMTQARKDIEAYGGRRHIDHVTYS